VQYVSNHSEAVHLLHNSIYKREKQRNFVMDNAKISLAKGLNLEALLITPVQRIPRYVLLLTQLLKYTSKTDPEFNQITESLKLIRKVAEDINTATVNVERRREMLNIQNQFGKGVNLITSSRRFICKGMFAKREVDGDKDYEFFLFNDLLLGSPSGHSLLNSSPEMIEINDSFQFKSLPDDHEDRNMIEILSSKSSFIMVAFNSSTKNAWLVHFEECVSEFLKNKKSRVSPNSSKRFQNAILSDEEQIILPVWAPNKSSKSCSNCQKEFTLINRRHHCRKCGKLVCSSCSQRKMRIGTEQARVCDRCVLLPSSSSSDQPKTLSPTISANSSISEPEQSLHLDEQTSNESQSYSESEKLVYRALQDYPGNEKSNELQLIKGDKLILIYQELDDQGYPWMYTKNMRSSNCGWVQPTLVILETTEERHPADKDKEKSIKKRVNFNL
jgi:FYVE/RhoGEF/PH domain-containing protein 5/6